MDFNTPITTLALAREYYKSMDCSFFHMLREAPERYEEYQKLRVPKSLEYQWKTEKFRELYDALNQDINREKVWCLHSRMEELVYSVNTADAYEKMLVATRKALDIAPDGDRILVAETINGRQEHVYRVGLIFRSFDRGQREYAKEYAALSLSLAESDNKEASFAISHRSPERIERAINDCKMIIRELGL